MDNLKVYIYKSEVLKLGYYILSQFKALFMHEKQFLKNVFMGGFK
jgi:hypothetical protein